MKEEGEYKREIIIRTVCGVYKIVYNHVWYSD